MKDYEKSEKCFIRKSNDIYTVLHPKLEVAVNNANALGEFENSNVSGALTEMYKLFESKVLKLGY